MALPALPRAASAGHLQRNTGPHQKAQGKCANVGQCLGVTARPGMAAIEIHSKNADHSGFEMMKIVH